MQRYLYIVITLCFVAISCSAGGPRLEPTSQEQAHLDAHMEQIFTGVTEEDAAQLAADRQRVADIHRIAYLAEQYKQETGSYPLVDPTGTLKNVIIGDDNGLSEENPEHYVSEVDFLAELRRVLGFEVTLPHDPLPSGPKSGYSYVYGVYGRMYGTAAMLYHPVGWSEGFSPHMFQYRIGGSEDTELPMLQATKLFAGEYTTSQPAKWRDQSMARP